MRAVTTAKVTVPGCWDAQGCAEDINTRIPVMPNANIHYGTRRSLQERTQAYCAEVKASPDCWRLCADRFASTGYVEVKFWCLQALHEVRLPTLRRMVCGVCELLLD